MKAADILQLTPDFGRHVCNHDGDCGQIRQPAVQVSRRRHGQNFRHHGAIVSARQQNTPASGSPSAADVLAYSSKSGEYRRIRGRTYVVAQLSKANIWGIPTSVSYFTHAGRLSALRSMITRYSSHIASAIASRNSARCLLAARAGAAQQHGNDDT